MSTMNQLYQDWLQHWQRHIQDWNRVFGLMDNTNLLLLLPELLSFTLDLARDERISAEKTETLLTAAQHTIYESKHLSGGFQGIIQAVEQMLLLAGVLERLLIHVPDPVINEHWHSREPLHSVLHHLLTWKGHYQGR